MIKHIFCDLDGTLLKEFSKISDEDIIALKLAQERGTKVSIATGRLDYEIKSLMNKYQFSGFRVSQNGAVIFDENDNLVYVKSLSHDDVDIILKALTGLNILIFFQTVDTYYVQEKVKLISDFERSQPFITYVENTNIYNELSKHTFITISLWAEENENILIKKHLDKVLPNHITSYVSSKYTLDITSTNNSKGEGITHLCQKHNIELNNIAVIGDSYNDISMFKVTMNSFVMKSAHEEIKREANYVVDSVKDAVLMMINR